MQNLNFQIKKGGACFTVAPTSCTEQSQTKATSGYAQGIHIKELESTTKSIPQVSV